MKNIISIFILLILLSSSANASLEADWIVSKSSNDKWSTTEQTAYAVLALKTESTKYSSQISKAIQILKTNLDNCIPNNECNVKDATLSILAIKDSVANLDIYTTWLANSRSIQYSGELTGWKVQIISPTKSGSCFLNNTETQTINVNIGYTPWQDISSTLLTTNTRSLELDCSSLQATDLILSLIQQKQVSGITYYYIKQEESGKSKITVEFGNPCWGSIYRASCDNDITALVLYTLNKVNKQNDATWLKQQTLTPLQNAYLYKTLQDQKYFDAVSSSQSPVGDWNQDIAQTAMISYLIKPSSILEKSYSWMNLSRSSLNCWPSLSCDVTTTSLVLMSGLTATAAVFIDADNDGIDDNWEKTYCNGNCDPTADTDKDGLTNLQEYKNNTNPNKADTDGDTYNDKVEIDAKTDPNNINDYPTTSKSLTQQRREACPEGDDCDTAYNCPGKCDSLGMCIDIEGDKCPESDTTVTEKECIYQEDCITDVGCKGKCNLYEMCEDIPGDNCPSTDIAAGAGAAKEPAKTPEQGRSILFWLLLVLLFLIALIGGGYLAYKKGLLKFKFTKKPKPSLPLYTPKFKPSPKTEYKPAMRTASHKSPFRKHIEESLEKSMEEMENLLRK